VTNREIGPNVRAFGLAEAFGNKNQPMYALTAFGKPARETNCDCERTSVPTLLQTLYTRNDPEMLARIEGRKDGTPTWITELRADARGASALDGLINEAFLRTVSRPPTPLEVQTARRDIALAGTPIDGVRDLLWSMLSTKEFLVNH
jgi:hypothetical protein